MRHISVVAFLALALVSGAGPGVARGAAARYERMDGLAAWVNEHAVTVSDVMSALDPVRRDLQRRYSGEDLDRKLKEAYRDALDTLIDRYLVLDQYKKGEARLPAWVVEQRVEEVIREMFNDDRSELMKALEEDRISYEDWRKRMEDQVVFASMRGNAVDQYVRVSPEDVARYYREHRDDYRSPVEVRVRTLTLPAGSGTAGEEARRRIDGLRERLLGGESFETVAAELPLEAGRQGGDSGWIDAGYLRAELSDAVGALEPGQISPVITAAGALYILKLEARRGGEPLAFADAQPLIERELNRRETDVLYKAWVARLRAEAYVKIVRDTLD